MYSIHHSYVNLFVKPIEIIGQIDIPSFLSISIYYDAVKVK